MLGGKGKSGELDSMLNFLQVMKDPAAVEKNVKELRDATKAAEKAEASLTEATTKHEKKLAEVETATAALAEERRTADKRKSDLDAQEADLKRRVGELKSSIAAFAASQKAAAEAAEAARVEQETKITNASLALDRRARVLVEGEDKLKTARMACDSATAAAGERERKADAIIAEHAALIEGVRTAASVGARKAR